VTVTLKDDDLARTLDQAYLLATSDADLPKTWLARSEQLAESPSVAFIAAVGAVLLAKGTDAEVDAFVIQKKEGSAGAYSLRKPATVLASKRHAYGYDIGSSSDRDPINHGTLVGSPRWDVALDRILASHKPFFQVILQWLADVNRLSQDEATLALAAFVRVRRAAAPGAAVAHVPAELGRPPALHDLVDVLEGFVSADPEDGARGMALVAAAYRTAGFDADVPSRNDPRRIDIPIKRDGRLLIACEVKQIDPSEATADTLVRDALDHKTRRALLAVLRPGTLAGIDRPSVIRRAERDHGVVLSITDGTRQLLHVALRASTVEIDAFCAALPRAFAEAMRDIRVKDETIDTWAAIAQRWSTDDD
jgi:SacI restriction endonuclease